MCAGPENLGPVLIPLLLQQVPPRSMSHPTHIFILLFFIFFIYFYLFKINRLTENRPVLTGG